MRRCAAPAALTLLGALATGCPAGPGSSDAGVDGRPGPDATQLDGPPAVTAVDFTVIGCPTFDPDIPQCRGPAPLTLTFVPITSGTVTRFLWDFGDLSPKSFEDTPTHTYSQPESYDVSLLGAPALTMQTRKAFVVVTANPLGGACDVERQCQTGLSCLCGLSAQCPNAFARGLCIASCLNDPCPESAFCADLTLGSEGQATPDSWRGRHCLRRCAGDSDCAAGQSCRTLPAAGAPERWERACFYRFPGELGAACRGGTGDPQKDLCLSGLCADLGALGICSLDCASRPCPTGTTCASFHDGRKLCLPACTSADSCRSDPLLACTPAGLPGPLGWDPSGPAFSGTLCAPKPCDSDALCGPAGICLGGTGASHCSRRTGTAP